MKLYVGVTDNEWFRFLRSQPEIDEVNFWQPSGNRQFRRLDMGEPFLFKLHSPENYIVGGGFFAHSSILPSSVAWEAFGYKNGASSFNKMRERIEKYRRIPADPHNDYNIGCIILESPFFFPENEWIPQPKDFSANIVQGKSYDSASPIGRELWKAIQLRIQATTLPMIEDRQMPMFGDPVLIQPRLGQGAFRVLITDTYQRRCAVTQEKALPVLEAAHIRPVSEGGLHRVDNGLLLRSDLHRLYDRGYVTVTPDYSFRVSRKLKEEFENGEPYYPLDKHKIWIPKRETMQPSRRFLEWHADEKFRG